MADFGSLLKGRWIIWLIAFTFAFAAGFGVLLIVKDASKREPYLVLTQPVAARQPITKEMLREIETSADGLPPNRLTWDDFQDPLNNPQYALIALKVDDVVSSSVVGKIDPLEKVVGDGYMLASLQVEPKNAAGGRIKAGDHIDIAAVTGGDGGNMAKIVMHNVLVVDVTVSPATIAEAATAPGPALESEAMYTGIPQMYTFAVTPEDFTKIALLDGVTVFLSLTGTVDPNSVSASTTMDELFATGNVSNSSEGLDITGNTTEETPTPSDTTTPETIEGTPAPSASSTPTN